MKYIEFKDQVMAVAAAQGLKDYELYASARESVETEALKKKITGFSSLLGNGACFRCIKDGKIGYASTELYTAKEAERIVLEAMENASVTENQESAFIYGPDSDATKADASSGDSCPCKAYAEVSAACNFEASATASDTSLGKAPAAADLKKDVLQILESACLADPRITDGSQAFLRYLKSTIFLSNSKGLNLSYTWVYSLSSCVAIAKEENGEEMVDGSKTLVGSLSDFDFDAIGKEAAQDALSRMGADTVATGQYPVVFSDKMMATLLATFLTAFSAEAAQNGLSLLNGKEGEQVAAPILSLTDDPFLPECVIHLPFDSEGVPTRRKPLIEKGILNTLLHNLSTAAKAGCASTGNGVKTDYSAPVSILPSNLFLEKGGSGQREDLFRAAGNGIYITELNGMHAGANPVTGDFSLSAAGNLITDGELGAPVKNFTVSGNFYRFLKDVALIGDDLAFLPPKATACFGSPSVMVNGLSIAGK